MRFSALLFLAALAGALVCAQDASSATPTAAPDTGNTEATTSPEESASPQETTQEPNSATPSKEGLNPLKSLVSKGSLIAEHSFQKVGKRLNERLQGGKHLFESGVEFAQNLKKFTPDFPLFLRGRKE